MSSSWSLVRNFPQVQLPMVLDIIAPDTYVKQNDRQPILQIPDRLRPTQSRFTGPFTHTGDRVKVCKDAQLRDRGCNFTRTLNWSLVVSLHWGWTTDETEKIRKSINNCGIVQKNAKLSRMVRHALNHSLPSLANHEPSRRGPSRS